MDIHVTTANLLDLEVEAIIVGTYEGSAYSHQLVQTIDSLVGGRLTHHMAKANFTGKELETFIWQTSPILKASHIIIVGLGKPEALSPVTVRAVGARVIQATKNLQAKRVATSLVSDCKALDPNLAAEMLVEGVLLGSYQFTRYKTGELPKTETIPSELTISTLARGLEPAIAKAEAIANAILNVRDITNEPPSKIKPINLVEAAREIATLSPSLSVTVLDKAELARAGYAALLAVAAGSEQDPYLIHLTYKPKSSNKSIAFVGKGVTFDSGGLGIKPWNAMRNMKADMAGGAAVLGIFQALAELENLGSGLPITVHGIIAATENMVSGKAMKPDDIIETKSGKTIEVLHTDAEGRLILSDALTYATLLNVEAIIDYATLTGAAVKALGGLYSAYMGNDQLLLDLVRQASTSSGELAWELPLPKEYAKQLESTVADLQNISLSDSSPGAIFGGLFLQEFVGQTPWVHFDIAGPAYQDDTSNLLAPKGATGYGVLLGLTLLELLATNQK